MLSSQWYTLVILFTLDRMSGFSEVQEKASLGVGFATYERGGDDPE